MRTGYEAVRDGWLAQRPLHATGTRRWTKDTLWIGTSQTLWIGTSSLWIGTSQTLWVGTSQTLWIDRYQLIVDDAQVAHGVNAAVNVNDLGVVEAAHHLQPRTKRPLSRNGGRRRWGCLAYRGANVSE